MPELPEVEIVVRGLRTILLGRTFGPVTVSAPPSSIVISDKLSPNQLGSLLPKRTITAIDRRGKNILVHLSGDLTLWVHLKMTGKFLWVQRDAPVDRHDLVRFDIAGNPAHQLRFNDYRRFGRLRLYHTEELLDQKGMKELGPEPLEITVRAFARLARSRPRQLKAALLDQSFLAGIGNIYADEALFASRLHPRRLTTSVSEQKLRELLQHIKRLLRRSIRAMGTSVDSYAGVNGQPGRFQNYLLVYNREGEPCRRCGATIVRRKIGARSAHYCPRCQRLR